MGNEHHTITPPEKVLVLGGGLSGLSATLRLLEHKLQVTLIEKRPFLGGRAFSFQDRATNVEIDNGQHIFMGCCTYYIDFLETVGAMDRAYLQSKLQVEIVRDGETGTLTSTPSLGRLHLLPSLLRYPHLGLRDKILAIYGLARISLTNRSKHKASLDRESGYNWLKRHHQTDEAIDNLWNLIVLPTLNDDVRNTSADMTLMVFQESLLNNPKDATIGYARTGLTSLNGEPAERYVEEAGAQIILSRSIDKIKVSDNKVTGVEMGNGQVIEADAYISALPFTTLLNTLPQRISSSPFFKSLSNLSTSPIVGIHLWYDSPIMDQDFIVFLDSPVQFVFNKSLIQQSNGRGQYVCISLSGAWQYIDRPKKDLIDVFTTEMKRLFPRAREAILERSLVIKEKQATFRSAPGARKHRPTQSTPLSNLFLAGEWTDTDWPSTMESAVRSGVFAADALVSVNRG